MKRTPIARRTSLQAKTELRRSSLLCSRSAPLRPVSEKRKRVNYERRIVVSAMRDGHDGRCPRCRRTGMELHGHERRPRSQSSAGLLAPDVLVCDPCNGAIADSVRVSCWNGWYVSPKWPHDPALAPPQARALDGTIVDFTVATEDVA